IRRSRPHRPRPARTHGGTAGASGANGARRGDLRGAVARTNFPLSRAYQTGAPMGRQFRRKRRHLPNHDSGRPEGSSFAMSIETLALVERVKAGLRDVIDPELGRDVVSLGLIYTIEATDAGAVHI